ncbi:MAG TPA: 5'-methylthioadenosine/adenosylhomocysteine nucleosidase [Bacillota bacterium]|nr:5'-methylthioadenosine/adenosylhomocysteine nucleosidase [Bacillota bacterium]
MKGIIGAMDKEIVYLLDRMENKSQVTMADKEFYHGFISGKEVVVAKSGIGKVNATMTTTMLLTNWQIEAVLNIGVAGGVRNCHTGDIVLADGIVYSGATIADIDDVPFGKMGNDPLIVTCDEKMLYEARKILEQKKEKHVSGIIASGDRFVTDMAYLADIDQVVDNIVACEMEGMAVAMTCFKFRVPFLSIRGISDMLGEDDQQDKYRISVDEIAKKTSGFALDFLVENV